MGVTGVISSSCSCGGRFGEAFSSVGGLFRLDFRLRFATGFGFERVSGGSVGMEVVNRRRLLRRDIVVFVLGRKGWG